MQNFDIHKFRFDNVRPSNGCNFALQKIKIMQRMNVLQCSENHDIHFQCTKLCTHKIMQNCIYLFKSIDMLKPENIKLNKNYIWDTLEIDWKEVSVTFNDNKINLPRVVTIKLQDKIKIRCLVKKPYSST